LAERLARPKGSLASLVASWAAVRRRARSSGATKTNPSIIRELGGRELASRQGRQWRAQLVPNWTPLAN